MRYGIIGAIIGAVVTVVIAGVPAVLFLGKLDQRMSEVFGRMSQIDDVVANGIESWASLKRASVMEIKFEQVKDWGTWGEARMCPDRHYVCGMRQALEPHKGTRAGDDDTALNAVAMSCCPLNP